MSNGATREASARTRKSLKLVEAALRDGATAEQVATDWGVRDRLVEQADVLTPSEETWATTVMLLDWLVRRAGFISPEELEEITSSIRDVIVVLERVQRRMTEEVR